MLLQGVFYQIKVETFEVQNLQSPAAQRVTESLAVILVASCDRLT